MIHVNAAPAPLLPAAADTGRGTVTIGHLMRSEWTKLRSLRSTWAFLLLAVAIGVGLAAAIGYGVSQRVPGGGGLGADGGGPPLPSDTVATLLTGTALSGLLLGVLGALTVAGEHATGTVTTTFSASPRRWMPLLAKALVVTVVVFPLSLLVSAASVVIGSGFLDEAGVVALGDEGVSGAVVGNAAYLTSLALLGAGLGALLRSVAAAITLLVAVVFVLPPLLPLIPVDWVATAADHFPRTAGTSLGTAGVGATLTDVASWITIACWALIPLVAGAVVTARRDV